METHPRPPPNRGKHALRASKRGQATRACPESVHSVRNPDTPGKTERGQGHFDLFVFGILIHDYCFLDNHFHLILWVPSQKALSRFTHQVLGQLARFINGKKKRKGQVFMDRCRTPVIQSGRQFLLTMRYIDKNPVRAGIVKKASAYEWSSYGYYAFGRHDDLVDPAPEFEGLHKLEHKRREIYRELVGKLLGKGEERLPEMSTWYFIGDRAWVLDMMKKRGFVRPRKPPDLFS